MPSPAAPTVVGVLLAAGLSRRLGQPKQLVVLAGRPLVWHSARAMLDAVPSGGVLVVVPPGPLGAQVRAALAGLDLRFTESPAPELGISESFRAAIRALPPHTGAASFALGDMPLVSAAMHRSVLDAYAGTNAPLVLARFDTGGGAVRAPPHLFRADLFAHFDQIGDHGPRQLIAEYAAQSEWIELPGWALRDLDTPEDIAGMEAALLERADSGS
ncbi:nucleotidyltransferase family protein [Deinococcus sp.]|uniref:nucleotidyltransferase family protein n=1 Tax=Deinococcus sp. TaxID=47478 RepID=UPI003CC59B76